MMNSIFSFAGYDSSSDDDYLLNYAIKPVSETMYQEELDPIEEEVNTELSTEELIRVAASNFIQLSQGGPTVSLMRNEIYKNVELATLLISVADNVSMQQYNQARNLLHQSHKLSSKYGNPVQRIAYYFSKALQEKIDRETGKLNPPVKSLEANQEIHLIMHYSLPFPQILQFTSIQAILDNIATAKRTHMIDLSIHHGLQWTILIQALATRASCPIDSLKITALASSEESIAATGKRLSSFAASLNLPFEFRPLIVPDLDDLREDMFKVREGEVVGVYSGLDHMSSFIVKPERLEHLMKVIQKLKPSIVTVIDVEGKHNSTSFINRFVEGLFYFSALFDCLDILIGKNDENRVMLEDAIYGEAIRSIFACEGEERVVRYVGISVWREFFKRFGLVEAELSEWSLYQGSILLKQFMKGELCSIEKNGKSLVIGWKGMPLNFVSAWKFQKGRGRLRRV